MDTGAASRGLTGARIRLEDGARVLVVGGGPAGSFFAITLLREARRTGRRLRVRILERRAGLVSPGAPAGPGTSCNYCAGGVSPRLADALDDLDLALPREVVKDRIDRIVVQSHWKSLQLRVPEGRRLLTVYRGSRPSERDDRHRNFDAFLLEGAAREGAERTCAEVIGLLRSADGLPVARLRHADGTVGTAEAEFLAFAVGVNPVPGGELARAPLLRDLAGLLPGFVPPAVRRTLIFELELAPELADRLAGELTFVLYGSRRLRLEMGSLMPKGRFATVVLIGRGIDEALAGRGTTELIEAFLALPHVERILPRGLVRPSAACLCRPNMVIGRATSPCGDRVAVVGDLVASRLYKDGLHSAYLTGRGLALAALRAGVDGRSLERSFRPLIHRLRTDQRCGRVVFLLMGLSFRNPVLSRMTYQAVLRERRVAPAGERPLEDVLWRVASGDDGYASILRSMIHPRTLLHFFARGVLVTFRNRLTELLFGLSWRGFGRYPTGVYLEDVPPRIAALRRLGVDVGHFRDFRRMYSVHLNASPGRVYAELGRLGDPDREFLKPRFLDVVRESGRPNEEGGVLRYEVLLRPLSFRLVLERARPGRVLAYRVRDGFARGGLLVFHIEPRRAGTCRLDLLVAFDFRKGDRGLRALVWAAYRHLFPSFVHDVLWNHALCKLKDTIERGPGGDQPPPASGPRGAKNGKALSN